MNDEDKKIIKSILQEYTNFVQETAKLVSDVKRATVLSLIKTGVLNEGDTINIRSDGKFEVNSISDEGVLSMAENNEKKSDDEIMLNGKLISNAEFLRQKELTEKQSGAKLEEVSKNHFKLHLRG